MSTGTITLSSIPAIQKRLKDWGDFLAEGGVQDPQMQVQMRSGMEELKQLLASCWKTQSVGPAEAQRIADVERRLTQLDEEARMTVVGKLQGTPSRML